MKKRIFRIGAALLFFLMLLFALLHVPPVQNLVGRYALGLVEKELRLAVSVESVDYNLFTFSVSLKGVILRDKNSKNLPAFFKADSVRADLTFSVITQGKLELEELSVSNPRLVIYKGTEEVTNIPAFSPGTKKRKPGSTTSRLPEFRVGKMFLTHASFLYVDRGKDVSLGSPLLDVKLEWRADTEHVFRIQSLRRGTLVWKEKIHLRPLLSARGILGSDFIDIQDFQIETARSRIGLRGRIEHPLYPDLDLDGNASIDAAGIDALLPGVDGLSGSINAKIKLEGSLPLLRAGMQLRGRDIKLGRMPEAAFETELNWKEGLLSIPSVQIHLAGGKISGRGKLHPREWKEGNHLHLRLHDLDLSALAFPWNRIPDFSSTVSGGLKARWDRLDWSAVGGSLGLTFRKAESSDSGGAPGFSLWGKIQAEASPRRIRLYVPGLFTEHACLSSEAVLEAGNLSGKYRIEAGNLHSILTRYVSPDILKRFSFFGGNVLVSGKLEGTVENPHIWSRWEGAGISFLGLSGWTLSGEAVWENGAVQVNRFRLAGAGAELNVKGVYAGDSGAVGTSIRLKLAGLPVDRMFSALGIAAEPHGALDLDGKISRILPFPRFKGEAELTALRYSGFQIDRALVGLDIGKQRLKVDLSVPSPSLTVRGYLGLIPPFDFEGQLEVDDAALSGLQAAVKAIPPIDSSGKLNARLDFKGNAASYDETEISGRIEAEAAALDLAEPPLAFHDIHFDLSIQNSLIEIKPSSFRLNGGLIELEGRVPFSIIFEKGAPHTKGTPPGANEERPGRINLGFTGLDPFAVGYAFQKGLSPDKMSGLLNGNLELTFPSLGLDSMSAAVHVETLELGLWGVPLELEMPGWLRMRSGKLSANDLSLAGDGNAVRIGGTLDLTGNAFQDFYLEGKGDLKIFQAFLEPVALAGKSRYRILAQGPFGDPSLSGFMELTGVDAALSGPDLHVSGLSGEIRLEKNRISLRGFEGNLNGGDIELEGILAHRNLALEQGVLNLSAGGISLDYPRGLRSVIDGQLTLESEGKQHILGGEVSLLSAEYKEPFNVESRLFNLLRSKGRSDFIIRRNPFLDDLDFNIQFDTVHPAIIDNNLAEARIRADLKLTGSPYGPGLSGRIDFVTGGELYFAENTYKIEQATIDFINPNQIVPDIALRGRTRVSGYLIQLMIFGTPEDISARLVSDPPLAESDIVSLLLTGRRLEYVSSSLLDVVSQQALDYLEGAFLGEVERIAEQTFGLDSVRIDTSLIAAQENPEARITVGQNITPEMEFVFSQGLRETDERTFILNYNPVKNVDLRGIKQDNDAFQFDAMHELRFGLKEEKMGPAYMISHKGAVIGKVEFHGELGMSEEKIRRALELEEGERFDFFIFQKDQERIRELYLENRYLESKLDSRKKETDEEMVLNYHIASGPVVLLRFSGAALPPDVRKEAARAWMEGVFPRKRHGDVRRLIEKELFRKGYYQSDIRVEEQKVNPELKTVRIRIFPGPKYERIIYGFEGRQDIKEQELLSILDDPETFFALFSDPGAVADAMEAVYRHNGYLNVRIETPSIDFRSSEGTAAVTFPIQEGSLFRIGKIEFPGRLRMDRKTLLSTGGISEGNPFTPEMIYRVQSRIKKMYSKEGFVNARVESRTGIDMEKSEIRLSFDIQENEKAVIQDVAVFGNKITETEVIKGELNFETGQAVDHRKFNSVQKQLYGLGIFNTIRIDSHPLDEDKSRRDHLSFIRPHQVEVLVEEMEPFYLRYGAQYDTETGLGGVAELVRRNFLGRAMDVGGSIQANQREQDARIFFRSPHFLGKRLDTSLFGFATRKEEPGFTTSRLGATLQQQLTLRNEFVISYNYTFERLQNLVKDEPLPEGRYNIGRISLSVSRDRREDIFDSLRGSFFSLTGEYAEKVLASDVRYLRFFGQYFIYLPLGQSLTYAAAVRTGLGQGLGRELVPSVRFFAGGGSSLRGFGYHEVGPQNPITGNPEGGNAVFIWNQELRFPVYKIFGGVLFLDLGNVYPSIPDFDPLNLRKTAGLGLRMDLGFALGRLDLGFKLDRRDGESACRLHFSLGQAF